MQNLPETPLGVVKRHDDWDHISHISRIGRETLDTIPNYRLLKAATRCDASPQARLLLVHLIGYLGVDQTDNPASRFVVFPGNTRLADELHYSTRSIQRLSDELEAAGLLRRCYNGLNRRVGFDLTPLAMRHETIEASIVAIHTQRKLERDQLQLELSLTADRIERPVPVATKLTPQGDKSDTQNKPINQDSAEPVLSILDSIDPSLTDKLSGKGQANQEENDDAEANVLRHLTGSGRAAHLGWALAKKTFGFDRALAICAIAHEDPKRKASPERYFGWLVRMAMTVDGHEILAQAIKRIEKKAVSPSAKPKIAVDDAIAVYGNESAQMIPAREALREAVGPAAYHGWLRTAELAVQDDCIVVKASTRFAADYIEANFGVAIVEAVRTVANDACLLARFEVA